MSESASSSSVSPVLRNPLVLLVGVLLVQLAFIASYVGAFHAPTPHEVPIAVVGPPGAPSELVSQSVRTLNEIDGKPLKATIAKDEKAARDELHDRKVSGVLLLGEQSDQLLVASAGGASESEAIETVIQKVAQSQQRTVTTVDVIPADKGDSHGLSSFYLAVGWVVGGYLAASILGITVGARLPDLRRLGLRIISLLGYSVLSGLGGAWVVGPWLGALDHGYWSLAALGALVVFSVGVATFAFQTWLGVIGIGVAILLFVVLGNPSAGGAYPSSLLPPFFSTIGPWLPPGAATSGIRGIVYFDDAGVRGPVLVLLGWMVLGLVGMLAGTLYPRQRSHQHA